MQPHVTAEFHKGRMLVFGQPDPEDESHSCDALGCGSVGPHVLERLSPIEAAQELYRLRARVAELTSERDEAQSRAAIAEANGSQLRARTRDLADEFVGLEAGNAQLRARVAAQTHVVQCARRVVEAWDACDREAARESRSSAPMVRYIDAQSALRRAVAALAEPHVAELEAPPVVPGTTP